MTEVKKVGGRIALVGGVTIVLGILSIAAPLVTGIAITLLVGGLVLSSGAILAWDAWQARAYGGGIGALLWAILYAVIGVLILANPMSGLASLTLVLATFFFLAGAWKTTAAFRLKPRAGWSSVLVSGLASLLLGLMILLSWPMSGAWAIGTLVGVELLFDGFMLLTAGATLRSLVRAAE